MEIGIIGGSASGVFTALLLARKHPDWKISIFEKEEKLCKKVLATGNGHCNIMNRKMDPRGFNHPEFVEALLQRHPAEELLETLRELGIALLFHGDLVYPLSYSAAALVRFLCSLLDQHKVSIHLGERVVGVADGKIQTEKGKYPFDQIIYAFGGRSSPQLGSDGSLFQILERNGYSVTPQRPSLCPLKSPDVPKSLFGVRHEAKVELTYHGQPFFSEEGEILFKKDGVSGIVIMNASAHYKPGCVMFLDLFPSMEEEELAQLLHAAYRSSPNQFLQAILEKPLADFVASKFQKKAQILDGIPRIAHFLKHISLRISGLYDYESSHVTRGGVHLEEVNENLQSIRHSNEWFVGECLDIDGLCGGYNLGWAILSAKIVSEAL